MSKYWEISAVADQKTNDTKGVLNAKKSNGVGRKNHLFYLIPISLIFRPYHAYFFMDSELFAF
ncbi:hypothetical protein [Bartonella sp. CL266QHHD]|uniref:hypothetical protein n=1 Tax=Bartonella sp. CL266QHHD TaxID=3243519 RepID=UPI0035CF2565